MIKIEGIEGWEVLAGVLGRNGGSSAPSIRDFIHRKQLAN